MGKKDKNRSGASTVPNHFKISSAGQVGDPATSIKLRLGGGGMASRMSTSQLGGGL